MVFNNFTIIRSFLFPTFAKIFSNPDAQLVVENTLHYIIRVYRNRRYTYACTPS